MEASEEQRAPCWAVMGRREPCGSQVRFATVEDAGDPSLVGETLARAWTASERDPAVRWSPCASVGPFSRDRGRAYAEAWRVGCGDGAHPLLVGRRLLEGWGSDGSRFDEGELLMRVAGFSRLPRLAEEEPGRETGERLRDVFAYLAELG